MRNNQPGIRNYDTARQKTIAGSSTFSFLISHFSILIPQKTFLLLAVTALPFLSIAQSKEKEVIDSVGTLTTTTKTIDTTASGKVVVTTREYNPKKAALRSAIFPGLGQIYNKKYWKLPIIYGALGISGGVFIYNLNNYKHTRFAYRVKYNMRVFHKDSALFDKIKPAEFKLFTEESLRFYRDEFRRDIDYSVVVFILLWGLNVVDAAVDSHLKAFDVSPDLSLQFKPGYSEMAGTSGVSLVLNIGKRKPATLPSRF